MNDNDMPDIDREIRLNELTEELREMGIEPAFVDGATTQDREVFLDNIIRYESAPVGTQFDRLERSGVAMPPPDALDDAGLHAKLWEVIRALAGFKSFLYHTDHLSDRELYRRLWFESLREEVALFPVGSGWQCHIDLVGGGSEEDIQIGLRYYDSEESRESWRRDFPDMSIPPREPLPYDRDRLLPKAS